MRDPPAPLFLILLLVLGAGCTDAGPGPTAPSTPAADPLTLTWTTRADMPVPRTEVTCAALGQEIYVLGGFNNLNAALPVFHRYDAADDIWEQLADFPIPIHHTGLVAHENAILVFGGYTGNIPFVGTNAVWRYTPSNDQWSLADELPRPRGAHATARLGDDVYLIGGAPAQPGQETYDNVDVYNLTTRTFREGPTLSMTREHLAGAATPTTLVAAGGRRMSLENFDLAETLTRAAPAWLEAPPMPTPRGGIAATAHGDKIFVFGGERGGGTHDEAEWFDVPKQTWFTAPKMPHARHGLCAVTVGDDIHVIGGGPQAGLSTSSFHEVLEIQEK